MQYTKTRIKPHRAGSKSRLGDTLDSAFAETGLPLFAIDLRRASRNDAVHRWLSIAHRMRTIGGGYNGLLPAMYLPEVVPEEFDVIFFVKLTTPARKNPSLPKVIDPELVSEPRGGV